jgi:hypothetical protein
VYESKLVFGGLSIIKTFKCVNVSEVEKGLLKDKKYMKHLCFMYQSSTKIVPKYTKIRMRQERMSLNVEALYLAFVEKT